jgi:hypothetical protein
MTSGPKRELLAEGVRRHTVLRLLFLMTGLWIPIQQAAGCDYCFISEHGYTFDLNRTMIRLDSRVQVFSGLTNSRTLVDEVNTRYVSTIVTANYASGRWGVTVALPYVYREQVNSFVGSPSLHYEHLGRQVSTVDSSSLEAQTTRGIGDMTAMVRHAVMSKSGDVFASVFIQGGLKLATGDIDARDAYGFLLHPHLQSGTGTTLVLAGVSANYGSTKQSVSLSILSAIPVAVRGRFREPQSLVYDGNFRFRIFPDDAEDGPMLIANLGILGKLSGQERYNGAIVRDSGGHYMFLNGGLTFQPLPWCALEVFAQIPMIKNLTGNQLDEQFRLVSALQVTF